MKYRLFASGAAVGAAVMLAIGAAGQWSAAYAQTSRSGAVNAPATGVPPAALPSFANLVDKVAPAVVSIDVEMKPGPSPIDYGGREPPSPFGSSPGRGGAGDDPFGFGFAWPSPGMPGALGADGNNAPRRPAPMQATGSGLFISPDGYIATNNHVVQGAQKITVVTKDGRRLPARVVGRDTATDLAVVKVDGGGFPFVSFENRARPRVGDWVVAVGNPFGLGGTATAGIVSALGRQNISGSSYVDYMQIDAPINRGNSGGPTFDVDGRVVGVNTAIFSPSGGSVGIGFDIPADVAAATTRQLIESGKVTRGYIGATVQTLSPELAESMGLASAQGALVAGLAPGGPAQQAGLRPGDLVVSVDGQGVQSATDVTRQVALARPGTEVRLGVLRSGQRRDIAIRSALRPTEASLSANPEAGGDE